MKTPPVLSLLALLGTLGLPAAGQSPRVSFSKSFPGSEPAYFQVVLHKDGSAEYRENPTEEPLTFRLGAKETGEIFSLAGKLDWFKRELESNLKVAQTGKKTFRFEDGAVKNEVTFNYSLDADARALWDWFEKISESERHLIRLQQTARYDKLGVNNALLQLEISRDRGRLVAPEQFLPILDRIVKNQGYLHMARERAARLADGFRGQPHQPTQPQ